VKITQFDWNGNEVILRINGSGEIIGAFGLLASATRTYCSTAQTLQPSTALVWEAASFESILGRFPIFHRNVTRVLQDRLQELEQRFRKVSTEKVGPRVSSQLIRLTKQLGLPIEGQVKIGLSRAELAQLTGTTLFTVSRLLCRWQSLGIVHAGRRAVLVRDVEALTEISQKE
jgi:CRP-like cAMP-binding protein